MFVLAESCAGALHVLREVERHLADQWRLRFKPSSKSLLLPLGCEETCTDPEWSQGRVFECLGRVVSHDGSAWPDARRCIQRCWAAFWASAGHARARALSVQTRLMLLRRRVLPHILRDGVCWPLSKTQLLEVRSLQRRMIAACLRVHRETSEPADEFYKRRLRRAAELARSEGCWAKALRDRALAWRAHLLRASSANRGAWAAQFAAAGSADWLRSRRNSIRVTSGGRPQTRARPGFLCARWEESL